MFYIPQDDLMNKYIFDLIAGNLALLGRHLIGIDLIVGV